MAGTTTRLGLRKPDDQPAGGDNIDVTLDIADNMDKIDAAVGYFVCTSGTRPTTTAWQGMAIFETDTGRAYIAATSGPAPTWVQIIVQSSTMRANTRWDATGDTQDRLRIDAATGKLNWGPGNAATDVGLSRTAANELSLDNGDIFKINGDIVGASENGINVPGPSSGTDATTGTTFTNMGGTGATTSFSFTKRFTSTRVRIDFAATFWSTNADTGVEFAVNFNAADHAVCRLMGNSLTANQRLHTSGFRYISSIPAGAHTIQARWREIALASGAINRNLDDFLCISAKETN